MAPEGVILLAPWPEACTQEEPWAPTAATLRGFQQSFGLTGEDKNLRCRLLSDSKYLFMQPAASLIHGLAVGLLNDFFTSRFAA